MKQSFEELGLSKSLLNTIQELKFKEPSEIQEKAIPVALQGKDIIGGSATGSGKTLAFGANILEKVEKGKGIQALILTPTRELAEQVTKSLIIFSKYKPLRITPIYGGVSILPQYESLKRTDIVVGTPGRILDHLSRRTLNLSKVKYLVLDEADRMLDMGFLPDVEKIIKHCPKERQTFLFSATISNEISRLSRKYMNNPVEISVESRVDPSLLKQIYYDVEQNQKFSLLVHLLKQEKSNLVMIFSNTKRNANFLEKNLKQRDINAMALHGDLSQNQRNRILEKFHSGETFVLVCTDIAARGLDIKNVSHVYNYDSPKNSTDYIHRIGRTARAGKEGIAITIIGSNDYENFQRVIMDSSLNIEKQETPNFENLVVATNYSRDSGRGYNSSRGSSGYRGGGRSSSSGYRGSSSRSSSSSSRYGNNKDSRSRSSGSSSYGSNKDFRPRRSSSSSYGNRSGSRSSSGGKSYGSRRDSRSESSSGSRFKRGRISTDLRY